ncbi:MAG: hypothetical protein GY861_17225 [bacterium]|nr:hypothetical protein [bacterium]
MKSVQWITQDNPTSPDYYSKEHLTKDNEWCLCGQPIPRLAKAEFKDFTQSVSELLEKEKKSRTERGTDMQGLYCLTCLKKALGKKIKRCHCFTEEERDHIISCCNKGNRMGVTRDGQKFIADKRIKQIEWDIYRKLTDFPFKGESK